ncbi:MAG: ATP-binding protein [Leeuwenhoekiella sp.]
MIRPLDTPNEKERLDFLMALDIMDTLPENEYDFITRLATRLFNLPVALISLVEKDRQWFKSRAGMELCETSRDVSFCAHALHGNQVMVVSDADTDERFADNPLVTSVEKPIKFYAGVPLILEGKFVLGTLCIIDHKARQFSGEEQGLLQDLGNQVIKILELRLANKKVNLQQRVLEEQYNRLQDFAGVISHDMKMPLANIVLTSDLIKTKYGDIMDAKGLEYIQYLKTNSLSLSDYINSILQFYQSDNYTADELVEFDLNELLESIIEMINIDDTCHIDLPDENLSLHLNRAGLSQIFLNLIVNAMKYNDKEVVEIDIIGTESEEAYSFSVTDNGKGIPEKHLDDIFELYQNLGAIDKKGNKGNGIGLAMVKKICENLGGNIHVSSNVGIGTTFTFELPKGKVCANP